MDRHFDEELQKVKKHLLEMAVMVEEEITKALEALKKRNDQMAAEVKKVDHEVDKYEVAIEDQCIELIARHQPVGTDLRFLVGVIKMNNDLERMGDHAVNIADQVGYILKQVRHKPIVNIWAMAKEVKAMLRDSVESFVNNDPDRAQRVCERDSTVDHMRDETIRILLTHMLEEPEQVGSAISYVLVAKNLERIADLSTNVCEDVVYITEARVIKHHAEEAKSNKDAEPS